MHIFYSQRPSLAWKNSTALWRALSSNFPKLARLSIVMLDMLKKSNCRGGSEVKAVHFKVVYGLNWVRPLASLIDGLFSLSKFHNVYKIYQFPQYGHIGKSIMRKRAYRLWGTYRTSSNHFFLFWLMKKIRMWVHQSRDFNIFEDSPSRLWPKRLIALEYVPLDVDIRDGRCRRRCYGHYKKTNEPR